MQIGLCWSSLAFARVVIAASIAWVASARRLKLGLVVRIIDISYRPPRRPG